MEKKGKSEQVARCKECGRFYRPKNKEHLFCRNKCRNRWHYEERRYASRLIEDQKKTDFSQLNKKTNSPKINYIRLTFLLSFLGFLGSVGFYLGVLREIYSPKSYIRQIEVLEGQNQDLEKAVVYLSDELKKDKDVKREEGKQ